MKLPTPNKHMTSRHNFAEERRPAFRRNTATQTFASDKQTSNNSSRVSEYEAMQVLVEVDIEFNWYQSSSKFDVIMTTTTLCGFNTQRAYTQNATGLSFFFLCFQFIPSFHPFRPTFLFQSVLLSFSLTFNTEKL